MSNIFREILSSGGHTYNPSANQPATTWSSPPDPDVESAAKQTAAGNAQTGNLDDPQAPLATSVALGPDPQQAQYHANLLKELATPVVAKRIQAGEITADDYAKHDVSAQDLQRQANGQPAMTDDEKNQAAEKSKSFWGQLGLDGKTAAILGASMLGAIAFKNAPTYNQAYEKAFDLTIQKKMQAQILQERLQERAWQSDENRKTREWTTQENNKARTDVANLRAQFAADNTNAENKREATRLAFEDKWHADAISAKEQNQKNAGDVSYEDTVKLVAPMVATSFPNDVQVDSKTNKTVLGEQAQQAANTVAYHVHNIRTSPLQKVMKDYGVDEQTATAMKSSPAPQLAQYFLKKLPTTQKDSGHLWWSKKVPVLNQQIIDQQQ